MKNVTKMLLVLLALAVVLSSVCIFASADTTMTEEHVDDVLEYFEMKPAYNLDGKYADDAAAAADIREKIGADSTLLPYVTATNGATEEAADGSYFSVISKASKSIEFNASAKSRSTYTFETRIRTNKKTNSVYSYARISYKYLDTDGKTEKSVKVFDISPKTAAYQNVWVTVQMVMTPVTVEVEDSDPVPGYSIVYTVKDDGGNVLDSNAAAPKVTTEFSGFSMSISSVGTQSEANRPFLFVNVDYLRMYGGSFPRSLTNYESEVDALLVDMMDLYQTTDDDALKLRILENVNKVTSTAVYKYVPESQDAKDAAALAASEIIGFYSGKLVSAVGEIDTAASYSDRVAKVEEINVFDSAVPATYAGDDAETVLAAKAAFANEKQALEELKNQSVGYLAAIDPITQENKTAGTDATVFLASKTYAEAKAYYDAVSPFTPCNTYEGVAETFALRDAIVASFTSRKERADAFLAQMAIVTDTAKDFGTRYTAFLAAGEGKFEDETREGITEALADYADFATASEATVALAKQFILAVGNASISTYYSQKIDYLTAATEIVDSVELTYPGAADAKAQYDDLFVTLDAQKKDVDAYLAAVAAILDNMTFMQKKDAVDAALKLQAKGSVTGFDGVSEANIKLSAYESQIKAPEGYSIGFIECVNAAKAATDLLVRREAILNAKSLLANAEDNYDGVTAAKVALAEVISAYNAVVSGINAEFSETATRAVETVSAAAPADCVKQVVAILKKVFVD